MDIDISTFYTNTILFSPAKIVYGEQIFESELRPARKRETFLFEKHEGEIEKITGEAIPGALWKAENNCTLRLLESSVAQIGMQLRRSSPAL